MIPLVGLALSLGRWLHKALSGAEVIFPIFDGTVLLIFLVIPIPLMLPVKFPAVALILLLKLSNLIETSMDTMSVSPFSFCWG